MAKIPYLSWGEIIVMILAVLIFLLIGVLWTGILLVIVALVGKWLKIGIRNRWIIGVLGMVLIVLSLILGVFGRPF